MSPLRKKMIDAMCMRGFAVRTHRGSHRDASLLCSIPTPIHCELTPQKGNLSFYLHLLLLRQLTTSNQKLASYVSGSSGACKASSAAA